MSSKDAKRNAPERYKIKVSGLPRFYALADPLLQDFLNCVRHELKLNCIYARFVRKGNAWLYLSFPTAEEQQRALIALKRFAWKGRTIVSMLVTSDVLKRKTDGCSSEVGTCDMKKQKVDVPISEQVLMTTIPYYTVPYSEQLKQKNEEAYSLVSRICEILMKRQALAGWCRQRKAQLNSSIPFILDKIRPSPIVDGYRNKHEFTVGVNPDLGSIAVGIRVQDRRDGNIIIGPVDGLRHLPKAMIVLVKIFEDFVISRKEDWQYWYHLIIRINRMGEIMVTVSTNPNKKDISREKLVELKRGVMECFSHTMENVVSINFQIQGDKPIAENIGIPSHSELLWGKDHIKERLLNLELEITPVTYFRINTASTEILCRVVAELAAVDEDTTVLDLFCGSGSIALTLAPRCKEVVAVELIESNIADAQKYAQLNEIYNCEFITGKIEDLIHSIIERLEGKKVVVILDPPRSGIDPSLVKTLRLFNEAKRFIYVCSNHKLPLRNLLDFSLSTSYSTVDADPILPVRITPIDMTPHTLRSELVILCERVDVGLCGSTPVTPVMGVARSASPIPRVRKNFANSTAVATYHARQPVQAMPPSGGVTRSVPFPQQRTAPYPSLQLGSLGCGGGIGTGSKGYAEDRYSSFRRDFENAIDSSYGGSPMHHQTLRQTQPPGLSSLPMLQSSLSSLQSNLPALQSLSQHQSLVGMGDMQGMGGDMGLPGLSGLGVSGNGGFGISGSGSLGSVGLGNVGMGSGGGGLGSNNFGSVGLGGGLDMDYLPVELVRKMEERAFQAGLTRGIQQSAFRVGYQEGLKQSMAKWDDLAVSGAGVSIGASANGGPSTSMLMNTSEDSIMPDWNLQRTDLGPIGSKPNSGMFSMFGNRE